MAFDMDFRTNMGSFVILTAGAVLGACVTIYFTTRRRKVRGSSAPKDDTNLRLREEVSECRKKLEELTQRLEEEVDRRRESEKWGRKLEQDLGNHVISKELVEEKVKGLLLQIQDLEKRAEDAEQENKDLIRQLQRLQDTQSDPSVMLPDSKTICMGTNPQPGLPPAHQRTVSVECPADKPGQHCLHVNTTPRIGRDYDYGDYDEDEDYDDYTDEEDYDEEGEREDGERQLDLIKQSMLPRQTSEENFELGKDVMGALIEKAFKGGMLHDRDETEAGQRPTRKDGENASLKNKPHSDPEVKQGEVSQESIGDIKSTRRFWEQMIASDLPEDEEDLTDDDVTDEGGDDEYESDYDVKDSESNEEPYINDNNNSPADRNGTAPETADRLDCELDQSEGRTTMTSQHDLKVDHYQTVST